MKLFVGLGNPGPKYEKNRHNVGFLFVDFLFEHLLPSSRLKQEWKYDKYISAESSILESKEDTLIFLKPQNYMNNSGISVGSITKKMSISQENIIVIHDDLDIPLGSFLCWRYLFGIIRTFPMELPIRGFKMQVQNAHYPQQQPKGQRPE